AYTFRKRGRPNGYILGEDAGGAFIAGLRYGEGRLFTKRWGGRKVYWQGPSVGYDFGGEGSKVMVLVYNLRRPSDMYHRFGGVQGSAYLVGGVGVQLQTWRHVTVAPIRSGVGLRFGANVGYLKYTRRPTWNPF
ncbi:MAG: EipA family protein, partial [Pseudomonadota bacterium]